MSIFIHKDSRVVVQGVTGKEGAFWAKHMKDMGTQVVFGVTPGKEGQDVDGIPVYHSVRRGIDRKSTRLNSSHIIPSRMPSSA